MHQQLKASEARAHGKKCVVSKYDPLELFSYSPALVKESLEHMLDTPQNNIRVFADQKLIFAEGISGGKSALDQILKNENFHGSADTFLDVVVEILTREPLFNRVRSAQMMDDMDIEAVYPVYKLLLESKPGVVNDLEQYAYLNNSLLPREPPQTIPTETAAQIELIQRFMIATTAKDCSVMITFRETDQSPSPLRTFIDIPTSEDKNYERVVTDLAGWEYAISIVDLDPKPLDKMQHYFDLDEKIATKYSKSLSMDATSYLGETLEL
eukprot:CAMPEP_0196596892 /NCGR_PEP_ID=MMETSP1081-20130531/88526_1 /TAXON_ID=36882 /ORGANISM="Pyramimonas amylifera, Strain CCMP720" /LENGTH=267 /DNA_ID=CAMNT_0041922091 /DNA_START=156 /DNA_END=959 /DNA_ORIENTATION=+